MRIAFVDLVFAWPPPGGAQADLYYTIQGLARLGHDVRLFAPHYDFMWRYGDFDAEGLPFPATAIPCALRDFRPKPLSARFRQAVDNWNPDVVFFGFGRYLKPYLIHALAHYPIISRYYMYEHLCIRDFCLFKNGETCPNDFLHTPDACRKCALSCWTPDIRTGKYTLYGRELMASRVLWPSYRNVFTGALKKVRMAIVNNAMAQERLDGICPACVIPGGVDPAVLEPPPRWERPKGDKHIILAAGRMDDVRKGLEVVLEAALGLYGVRQDFEVWITQPTAPYDQPWLKAVGWHDHEGMQALYREADICVVPSIWAEPYGLVALEAMAAGVAVCVSRIGGLEEIVEDEHSGLHFEAGDATQLALQLNRLMDSPGLCQTLGEGGRARAQSRTWDAIIDAYYPSLLDKVMQP